MRHVAGLALLLMACAGDAKTDPRGPAESGDVRDQRETNPPPVVLTAAAPRHEVAIAAPSSRAPAPTPSVPAAAPGGPPTTLTITVAAIDNPSSQAFSISAELTADAAGAHTGIAGDAVAIGSITPYPADLPGQFVLALPEPARERVARDTRSRLRLTLHPISADRPLAEPLRVTIDELIWR